MQIDIDIHSGFCYGVRKTVQLAENLLKENKTLYCIGEIVHNREEVERLKQLGLVLIDHDDLNETQNKVVLFRAHGESNKIKDLVYKNNNQLHDGTCPIVLKLQTKVRTAWEQMQSIGGQVVIFGNTGHAEVLGLLGQTEGHGIVVESEKDFYLIDFKFPICLFSQTTQSESDYIELQKQIRQQMEVHFSGTEVPLKVFDTICGHVSKRGDLMANFAQKHDVIIFVSGKNSSNGKVLFTICQNANKNSFWISNPDELQKDWFLQITSVGICGATSTPLWLLEKVKNRIITV